MQTNNLFPVSSCAAFTWNDAGLCCGVLLEVQPECVRVLRHWQKDSPDTTPEKIGATLAEGRRILELPRDCRVLLGSADTGWGTVDLTMPSLPQAEMQNALAFELQRHIPLPADQITWGYRTVPPCENATGTTRLRLFYLPQETWNRWLDIVRVFGQVDFLAPPPILLDPLFSGRELTLPGPPALQCLCIQDTREFLAAPAQNIPSPFPSPFEEKRLETDTAPANCHSAILLALYGLGSAMEQDSLTLPPLPPALRLQRYHCIRMLNIGLLSLALLFILLALLLHFQKNAARIRLLRKDSAKIQATITGLRGTLPPQARETMQELENELDRYQLDVLHFPAVLAELTRRISPPAWLSGGLEWKASPSDTAVPVTLTVREPNDSMANSDLASRLNDSPLIGDAREIQIVQTRNNQTEHRIVLNARRDLPGEEASPAAPAVNATEKQPAPPQ